MRLIKNTTELIGIKDPNIIISLVFETDIHIEVQAKLEYQYYYVLKSVASSVKVVGKSRGLRHISLRKTTKFQIQSDKRSHNSSLRRYHLRILPEDFMYRRPLSIANLTSLISRNIMTNYQLLCPGMSLVSRKVNSLLCLKTMRTTNSYPSSIIAAKPLFETSF